MEKRIINCLDNLTIEQTERLIDKNIEMKISGEARNRIKSSVFEKTGLKNKKRFYIPKKLVACVATLAIIFGTLSIVGFDNAVAAIRNFFTFIPGVGIEVKSEDTIYTLESIVGQTKSQTAKASVVRGIYSNGYLSATILVEGKKLYYDDFTLYAKGNVINYDEFDISHTLYASSDSTVLNYSYETEAPASGDVFEFEITGFSERLSFKMIPCRDYEDIKEIGPTDIQNGISITTTTQRIDNQLIVWCYPFKITNTTKDMILGYGEPSNSAFNMLQHIETGSGKIFSNSAGLKIRGRTIFNMAETDQSATLHIPYLSMLRKEKKKLNVNLPKTYAAVESDASIQCSLGMIKVTEVKRTPSEYENDKDIVMIKFAFDSKDDNRRIYSFFYEIQDKYMSDSIMHFNAETGQLEYLEICVDKDTDKISLNITGLFYYLFGEYVIPLDIQ